MSRFIKSDDEYGYTISIVPPLLPRWADGVVMVYGEETVRRVLVSSTIAPGDMTAWQALRAAYMVYQS